MPIEDKKLAKFEAALKRALEDATDGLTKEEFEQAFSAVLAYVKDIKATNEKEFEAIYGVVYQLSQDVKDVTLSNTEALKGQVKAMSDKALKEQSDNLNHLRDVLTRLERGKQGEPGKTPTPGIDFPLPKDGSPDSPEEVRNKLELLEGEERLDAKAIKNLPEVVSKMPQPMAVHGPLWSIPDVDVINIVVGQSIKWDGIRWIPFTPSGANTSVYGEVPTDSGDQTNFTLAHTPITGTLRLYRGGAYQQLTGDYTLSGATITLSTILATGEILQTDYDY